MNHTVLCLFCAFLLCGVVWGCEFEMFTGAAESFQLQAPPDDDIHYVGETVILNCTSKCGKLNWFVGEHQIDSRRSGQLENATANAETTCVNEHNTCRHEAEIDCNVTHQDGRTLHSELTITPTEEQSFLVQCELETFSVKIRKAVLLTAKRWTNTSSSSPSSSSLQLRALHSSSIQLPLPSTSSTPMPFPSSSASLPHSPALESSTHLSATLLTNSMSLACPTPSAIVVPLVEKPAGLSSIQEATPMPTSCEDGTIWRLAFVCTVVAFTIIILLQTLVILCLIKTKRKSNKQAAPIKNATGKQASTENTNEKQTSTEDANVRQSPTEDANVQQSPTEDANVQQSPTEDANVRQSPTENANEQQTSTEDANV